MSEDNNTPSHDGLPVLLITLFKNVIYREDDTSRWNQLLTQQSGVRDYVEVLGLELMLDEAEGYAFLRSRRLESDDSTESTDTPDSLPRLVARRPLSFPVSLLLALLRKKLAEFDAGGGDTRLILDRDDILELIRVFMPDTSNEAKLADQLDRHINKIIELGFLRKLNTSQPSGPPHYEVRRIIKSFVDAQWLADLDKRLEDYQTHLTQSPPHAEH